MTVNRDITGRASAERLRVIRADLLVRIRPVCTRMPNDLFLEMIEGMAALQLKYELQDGHYETVENAAPARGSSAGVTRA